ncbi:MAG: hypothetical protein GXX91_15510 [Verrucomicrobiaceae bacterium]|nr:hypothetical protein [Verrucomicrobiaceae bacterium]
MPPSHQVAILSRFFSFGESSESNETDNSRGLKGIEWQGVAPTEGTVVK